MTLYSWIFVDGDTQETFRIRSADPSWHADDDGNLEQAVCSFDIAAEDGSGYRFDLAISGGVLDAEGVDNSESLVRFITSKGIDIVESVLSQGFRGDQQIVWETDGVSLVR